jgi:predicted metal-dependent RNase
MAHEQSKYSRELAIEQLKADLISALPPNAQISKVEFEGPFVVLYSLNPTVLMENGDVVKSLAKTLRKRIVIRSDISVRREKEEARAQIRDIVPENADMGLLLEKVDPHSEKLLEKSHGGQELYVLPPFNRC